MRFRRSDYVDTPHGNSFVWRYMNDWKFRRLIGDKALFFPNASKLTDEYEVTIPERVMKAKRLQLRDEGLTGRDLKEELAAFFYQANPMKDLVLVNCWSARPDESYALWKIYLGGEKNGVAVRTTVSNLRTVIENGEDFFPEEFFLGKVRYRKHLKLDDIARLTVITTKKPYYDFEHELRAFILNYPKSEGGYQTPYDISLGRNVRVDVQGLFQRIYISPFSDPNYRQEVENFVASKLGNSAKQLVFRSEIRDQ
ncbi:MAG: hypothetical protein GKS02_02055 [Alphaproteobacteria bacterium]|nr:hypothetical protein [Alphaproteobacteria bacterium]